MAFSGSVGNATVNMSGNATVATSGAQPQRTTTTTTHSIIVKGDKNVIHEPRRQKRKMDGVVARAPRPKRLKRMGNESSLLFMDSIPEDDAEPQEKVKRRPKVSHFYVQPGMPTPMRYL